ncbi:MAG: VOC family protein [Bryobacterales bacterium]|nr:VOC family protein [Bryobacterales bacterium]
MFTAFEHTGIASPDHKKLAQWYVEVFGFAIVYQSAGATFVKAPNGSMIEIIAAEGDRVELAMKQPGLRHLALAVDDFDADLARIRAAGVKFLSEPVDAKGNKVVFFTDPEGNILHLIQRATPLP